MNNLEDKNDNSSNWGDNILSTIEKEVNTKPDFMILGKENINSTWFSEQSLKSISSMYVSRESCPISATKIRDEILENKDFGKSRKYLPSEVKLFLPYLVKTYHEIINGV